MSEEPNQNNQAAPSTEIGRHLVCLRCGYGKDPAKPWIQRGLRRPRQCWKCRTPYWDLERVRQPRKTPTT